jgi:hypothetical protein
MTFSYLYARLCRKTFRLPATTYAPPHHDDFIISSLRYASKIKEFQRLTGDIRPKNAVLINEKNISTLQLCSCLPNIRAVLSRKQLSFNAVYRMPDCKTAIGYAAATKFHAPDDFDYYYLMIDRLHLYRRQRAD